MPPKRGKRGRPKKVVKEPESEEESCLNETTASEDVGSEDESMICNSSLATISEECESMEKKEGGKQTEIKPDKETTFATNDDEVEDKFPVKSTNVFDDLENMESMENMESVENMDSMDDNYENMESMEENIENMESMENDEALDFNSLRAFSSSVPTSEIKANDLETKKIKDSGSAQYDPSIEDIDSPPDQSPKVDTDQMDVEISVPKIKKDTTGLEAETEAVSEDELPSEITKPPSDTEAVSDEELPPTHSSDPLIDTEAVSEDELPPVKVKHSGDAKKGEKTDKKNNLESITKATEKRSSRKTSDQSLDTEAVSEDEMPSIKKRKTAPAAEHDRKSMSVESDSKSSRRRSTSSSDTKDKDNEGSNCKKSSSDLKSSSKSLLELEKYWKAVKEDPTDFTGWTYLLQYVDQGQDVEAAREAYDAFLSNYPYCYGYWRKYAEYEKKKGDKSKSQEVIERGLAAIPLSVDLWVHYLNHVKSVHKDDEDYVRQQYDRAIDVCGTEFRSDRLWDSYIKWETENKNIAGVFRVYDKLLTVPTHDYKVHFENFVDFVKANQPNKMLSVDEFLSIRSEVLQKLKQKGSSDTTPVVNAPPGDESDDETEKSPTFADEETQLMRDKIISLRTKLFKNISNAVLERWSYEEGIKRPYFHVKPLERCQLNNWHSYLDYEIAQGDKNRTIVLFERCLIACALYDEFWMKFVRYLETLNGDDIANKIKNVYERACTIHHPKKPMLSLNWAAFEESQGNISAAREILIKLEKEIPNSLQISINRINLERRANNLDEVSKLYENYISSIKNKFVTNALSIKYSRFCQKILNDVDKGSEVLKKAIEKDKDNPRLYHQLFDLLFSRSPRGPNHEDECVSIINQFLNRETTDLEHKILFAQHKVEFLEDFGSSMGTVQKATADYMNFLKQIKEKRRKQFEEKIKSEDKKPKSEPTPSHPPPSNPPSNFNNGGNVPNINFGSFPTGPPQQPPFQNNSNQYQPPPPNYAPLPYNSQYNNQTDPNYNNYQNWNYQQAPGYNQGYNQGWNYNYY